MKEGLDLQRASFWRGLYFTKGQDCCPQLNAMVDVGPYQHLPFFFFLMLCSEEHNQNVKKKKKKIWCILT